MEVTLTIENAAGEQSLLSATGATYEALAAARDLIPEGSKAIVSRKAS